jgi:hypothetical protein
MYMNNIENETIHLIIKHLDYNNNADIYDMFLMHSSYIDICEYIYKK